jgi:hypothetical protein
LEEGRGWRNVFPGSSFSRFLPRINSLIEPFIATAPQSNDLFVLRLLAFFAASFGLRI